MKGSLGQKIKIILAYSIFGLGFGGLLSIVFVITKKIPDRFENIMMIAAPVGIIYIIYKVLKSFNSVEIGEEDIIFKSLMGSENRYKKSEVKTTFIEGGYTINMAPYAPILTIYVEENGHKVKDKYVLAIYNEEQIKTIISELE